MQPQHQEVVGFLIVANIIVVVAAVFFFLFLRAQQKRKQLHQQQLIEKEYKTREQAFLQISRDLHDEIGSSLSGISLFTQMAKQKLKENSYSEADVNIEKAGAYTSQVIEKVSDMAWLLKPSQESIAILAAKLKSYALGIAGPRSIQLHFAVTADQQAKDADIHQRKAIYLVSKEAINNAVKYAECRNIHCIIHSGQTTTRLLISDDGKGFETNSVMEGNGLRNMKARATDINAKINIESIPGSGTSIEMET